MARKTLNSATANAVKSGKLLKTITVRPGEDANIEIVFSNDPTTIENFVAAVQGAKLDGFSLRYMGTRVKLTADVKRARLMAELAKLDAAE